MNRPLRFHRSSSSNAWARAGFRAAGLWFTVLAVAWLAGCATPVGVVKYTSAHVDYAASECIVRGSHTCQDKPAAIEEVRRILLEHLATTERPSFSPVAERQGIMLSQP